MAKQKVGTLAEQKLLECGRLARDLCNNSGSRDVLMKAAKKIATNEQSMESTLQTLRQMEAAVEKMSSQSQAVTRDIEQLPIIQDQLQTILDSQY